MRLPTSAWSTIPCSPPTTLVSIVGHARFHTAGSSGPSIIERSYFLRPGLAPVVSAAAIGAAGAAVTSVNSRHRPAPSSDDGVHTPRTRAGEHEVQEEEAIENCGRAPISSRPERQRKTELEIRDCHLTGEHERDRTREQSERERSSQVGLQEAGYVKLPHRRHRQRRNHGWKRRKAKCLH